MSDEGEEALDQLLGMGFSMGAASDALIASAGDLQRAIQALTAPSDPHSEAPKKQKKSRRGKKKATAAPAEGDAGVAAEESAVSKQDQKLSHKEQRELQRQRQAAKRREGQDCWLCGGKGHTRRDCPGIEDSGAGQSKFRGMSSGARRAKKKAATERQQSSDEAESFSLSPQELENCFDCYTDLARLMSTGAQWHEVCAEVCAEGLELLSVLHCFVHSDPLLLQLSKGLAEFPCVRGIVGVPSEDADAYTADVEHLLICALSGGLAEWPLVAACGILGLAERSVVTVSDAGCELVNGEYELVGQSADGNDMFTCEQTGMQLWHNTEWRLGRTGNTVYYTSQNCDLQNAEWVIAERDDPTPAVLPAPSITVANQVCPVSHKVFLAQLRIAMQFNKPAIVSLRGSTLISETIASCLSLLTEEDQLPQIILHNPQCEQAGQMLRRHPNSIWFAFNGVITHSKCSRDTLELVFDCPLDKLLFGTGAPNFAPAGCGSRPCVPTDVTKLAEKVAEIKASVVASDVLVAAHANATLLFASSNP